MPDNHGRRYSKVPSTASGSPRRSRSSPMTRSIPRVHTSRRSQSSPTHPRHSLQPWSSPPPRSPCMPSHPSPKTPVHSRHGEDEDDQLDRHTHKRQRVDHQEKHSQPDGNDSESEDNDNGEDISFKGAWFITPARSFGRLYDMWIPIIEILEAGRLDSPDLTESDFGQRTWYKVGLHRELVAAIPNLYSRAKSSGLSVIQLSKLLEKKRSDACNEDIQRVKDGAQCLRPLSQAFIPALTINDKTKRGFHHPQLGRYVCPINWLDKYDRDSGFRQRCLDGKIKPTPNDLPLLLFDEDTFDMEDLFASFLRNVMLVHAWRMIFIGPKAAYDGVPAPRQSGRGNAAKNKVKHMTVGTLAYLATIVYYSLRSDSTFHAGGGENFDYSKFYRGIVTTLTTDASEDQLKELLLWWDRKVFPNYADEERPEQDEVDSALTGFNTSGRGLLKAQLRRKALSDRSNVA